MGYIIVTNNDTYLEHHGIQGQKWGQRKYQNEDGSLTPAGKIRYLKGQYKSDKRKATSTFIKSQEQYLKKTNNGKNPNKEADDEYESAADKWAQDRDKAKEKYKNSVAKVKESAVKDYQKKFNSSDIMQDKADAKWSEAKAQYHALGKTAVTRMLRAAGKSDAAKLYRSTYEEASNLSDKADEKWREAKEAYKNTGSNTVSRIYNNIKYDPELAARRRSRSK